MYSWAFFLWGIITFIRIRGHWKFYAEIFQYFVALILANYFNKNNCFSTEEKIVMWAHPLGKHVAGRLLSVCLFQNSKKDRTKERAKEQRRKPLPFAGLQHTNFRSICFCSHVYEGKCQGDLNDFFCASSRPFSTDERYSTKQEISCIRWTLKNICLLWYLF